MEIKVLKKPYKYSWSGNDVSWKLKAVSTNQMLKHLKLHVAVLKEIIYNPDLDLVNTQVIHEMELVPDAEGLFTVNIGNIADPFLDYELPRINTPVPYKSANQTGVFSIRYTPFLNDMPLAETTADAIFIAKGGLPFDGKTTVLHENEYAPLPLGTPGYHPITEESFMSFLIRQVGTNPVLKLKFYTDTATTIYSFETSQYDNPQPGQVYHVPVGAIARKLFGATVNEIRSVAVYLDNGTIADGGLTNLYFINQPLRNFKTLVFVNSQGGHDSVTLTAEQQNSIEFVQQVTGLAQNSEGNRFLSPKNIIEHGNSAQRRFTSNSGYWGFMMSDKYSSLLYSSQSFMIEKSRMVPVILEKKTLPAPTPGQLYNVQISWADAFRDKFFKAYRYENPDLVCPQPLSLSLEYSELNRLRISWALKTGYDKVYLDVELPSPEPHQYYTGYGNVGSLTVVLPSIPSGTSQTINVSAGTICAPGYSVLAGFLNPIAITPSYSSNINQSITQTGTIAPVGNDDYLDLAMGAVGNWPPGTILANDLDNMGFGVAAVPVDTVATVQGGTIKIEASGSVTYVPPSPTWTGIDSYTYTAHQVGDPTNTYTATVYINVSSGQSTTENVYAKVVRTVTEGGNPIMGAFYIAFYKNSAGTTHKNVSGLGITFYYKRKVKAYSGAVTETELSVLGEGTSMQIYNGVIYQATPFGQTLTVTFELMPGPGYTIIT